MEYIKWAPQFGVGIESIDRDHKQLIALLNELHYAVSQGKGDNILQQMIEDLKNYALCHFTCEEDFMREAGYPNYQEHVYRHEEFREELNELAHKDSTMRTLLTIELLEFLKDWVKDHILREDMKMARYVLQHIESEKLLSLQH